MAIPASAGRRFTIKYGDKTIGINEFQVDAERGKLRINQTVENFSIEFDFIILGTSVSNLEAETNDIEAAFKKIRQDVTITINGQTAWSFVHDDNTGYNSRATLNKVGGAKDGGLARTFHAKIDVGLPFEDSGLKGRRSSQISIAYSTNRRMSLNISGEYAVHSAAGDAGKKSAIENYYRAVNAYITSVKTSLFGSIESHGGAVSPTPVLVFERVSEDYSYDDQEKILNFSIGEQEILYPQRRRDEDGLPFDDPDLFNQSVNISQSRSWPGDSPNSTERYRITKRTANYSCLVKKDLDDTTDNDWSKSDVTDLLEIKYNDTIRPFMIHELNNLEEFQGDAQPLSCTIIEETVSYDKTGMAISASMTVDIIIGAANKKGQVLQKSITMADDESLGRYFVPVWATANQGGRLSKYLFNGPGSHVRRISAVYRVLNVQGADGNNADNIGGMAGKNNAEFLGVQFVDINGGMAEITPVGNGWTLMEHHAESTVVEVGTPTGPIDETATYTVTDYTLSTVSERFVAVKGSQEPERRGSVAPNDRSGRRSVAPNER